MGYRRILFDCQIPKVNFIHEKVIKPLKSMLKLLEIPTKLIIKRNDKLLDYECAKTNAEKTTMTTTANDDGILVHASRLYEAQKNYEALNNQLLEELPVLNGNCLYLLQKCLNLYLHTIRNMNENISMQISSLYVTHNDNDNNDQVSPLYWTKPIFTQSLSLFIHFVFLFLSNSTQYIYVVLDHQTNE